jgi:hypothetical protein
MLQNFRVVRQVVCADSQFRREVLEDVFGPGQHITLRAFYVRLDEVEPLQVLFVCEFVERRDFDFGDFTCSGWRVGLNANLVI